MYFILASSNYCGLNMRDEVKAEICDLHRALVRHSLGTGKLARARYTIFDKVICAVH